ncbi:MAG: hypothetical protein IJ003_04130 [Candidatus Gastranaerophilales bacterium]|nr:hypothetical protein [Candidatus Gastranaerophilales bacterium]
MDIIAAINWNDDRNLDYNGAKDLIQNSGMLGKGVNLNSGMTSGESNTAPLYFKRYSDSATNEEKLAGKEILSDEDIDKDMVDYILMDYDGDGNMEQYESGAALAKTWDSELDVYTYEIICDVLGLDSGVYHNVAAYLNETNIAKLRERNIECVKLDNRTYSFALVDDNGNVLVDENGNRADFIGLTDWIVPDGSFQQIEINFAAMLDMAGADMKTKADFIDPETGIFDEAGFNAFMKEMQERVDNDYYKAGDKPIKLDSIYGGRNGRGSFIFNGTNGAQKALANSLPLIQHGILETANQIISFVLGEKEEEEKDKDKKDKETIATQTTSDTKEEKTTKTEINQEEQEKILSAFEKELDGFKTKFIKDKDAVTSYDETKEKAVNEIIECIASEYSLDIDLVRKMIYSEYQNDF